VDFFWNNPITIKSNATNMYSQVTICFSKRNAKCAVHLPQICRPVYRALHREVLSKERIGQGKTLSLFDALFAWSV